MNFIPDPLFYLAAIPAVFLNSLSKGGFGGAFGGLAVPLMAMVIAPPQAAAIMLPLLCAADLVGLRNYIGRWNLPVLRTMLCGGLAGIAAGTLSFGKLDENALRLLVGAIAVAFSLYYFIGKKAADTPAAPSVRGGPMWSMLSGYTSIVAHAGGPPAMAYLIPQRMEKMTYVATMNGFFMTMNLIKLVPYSLLGQFDTRTLATSLMLLPLVPPWSAGIVERASEAANGIPLSVGGIFLFLSPVETGRKRLPAMLLHSMPIAEVTSYRFTMNNCLASGGDGLKRGTHASCDRLHRLPSLFACIWIVRDSRACLGEPRAGQTDAGCEYAMKNHQDPLNPTIRRARADEVPFVLDLYRDCGYIGGVAPQDVVLTAWSCEVCMGAVRVCLEHGVLVLRGMQIRAEYRGRRIGKQLLAAAIPHLDHAVSYCLPYSHLVSFYTAAGFRVVSPKFMPEFLRTRLEQYVAEGQDLVAMRREPRGNTPFHSSKECETHEC